MTIGISSKDPHPDFPYLHSGRYFRSVEEYEEWRSWDNLRSRMRRHGFTDVGEFLTLEKKKYGSYQIITGPWIDQQVAKALDKYNKKQGRVNEVRGQEYRRLLNRMGRASYNGASLAEALILTDQEKLKLIKDTITTPSLRSIDKFRLIAYLVGVELGEAS